MLFEAAHTGNAHATRRCADRAHLHRKCAGNRHPPFICVDKLEHMLPHMRVQQQYFDCAGMIQGID
eukprot:364418-Chlamydomonas_euryale.AAC.22